MFSSHFTELSWCTWTSVQLFYGFHLTLNLRKPQFNEEIYTRRIYQTQVFCNILLNAENCVIVLGLYVFTAVCTTFTNYRCCNDKFIISLLEHAYILIPPHYGFYGFCYIPLSWFPDYILGLSSASLRCSSTDSWKIVVLQFSGFAGLSKKTIYFMTTRSSRETDHQQIYSQHCRRVRLGDQNGE